MTKSKLDTEMDLVKKSRIFVYSDSIALPRSFPEKLDWEETWVQLLKKRFSEVIFLSLGGGKISELFRQTEYYKLFDADIVLVQSGIVDCAPRALSEFEKTIIHKYVFIDNIMSAFMTEKRQNNWRKKRNIKITTEELFEYYVNEFSNLFKHKLFWIGILPACMLYNLKVPGLDSNIINYNRIIRDILKDHFIDMSDFPESGFMSDFHHPNSEGHLFIYNKIITHLNMFN